VHRLGQNKPELISVLVPSRGRPVPLMQMAVSALQTATHQRRIEIVVRLDEDDAENYRPRIHEGHGVRYLVGPRALLSECWNECAAVAKGEILMHGGDDIVFATPGWDQQVRQAFAAIPDRIGLVYGDDLSTNFPDLATHGFLHRRWVDTVGYFLPPLFSCDWNDVWISEVAQRIGRAVALGDVVIEHQHHSFGKRTRDQTDSEREQRGADDDVVGLYKRTAKDREADADKLRAVMT
jgi:glycosyl transferase/beta-hydroxylase protein BlmF